MLYLAFAYLTGDYQLLWFNWKSDEKNWSWI